MQSVSNMGMQKVLLWKNSNSPQMLGDAQIDISTLYQYNWIAVEFVAQDSAPRYESIMFFEVSNGSSFRLSYSNVDTALSGLNALTAMSRTGTFNDNGIHFTNSIMLYNTEIYLNWTNRCVPIKIYGLY